VYSLTIHKLGMCAKKIGRNCTVIPSDCMYGHSVDSAFENGLISAMILVGGSDFALGIGFVDSPTLVIVSMPSLLPLGSTLLVFGISLANFTSLRRELWLIRTSVWCFV